MSQTDANRKVLDCKEVHKVKQVGSFDSLLPPLCCGTHKIGAIMLVCVAL